MPTIWPDSHVERLQGLHGKRAVVAKAVDGVRSSIEPLQGVSAAKVLAATALDVITGVQSRNRRADVNDACEKLQAALASLDSIQGGLDG